MDADEMYSICSCTECFHCGSKLQVKPNYTIISQASIQSNMEHHTYHGFIKGIIMTPKINGHYILFGGTRHWKVLDRRSQELK